jgi:hypothetical protein
MRLMVAVLQISAKKSMALRLIHYRVDGFFSNKYNTGTAVRKMDWSLRGKSRNFYSINT